MLLTVQEGWAHAGGMKELVYKSNTFEVRQISKEAFP